MLVLAVASPGANVNPAVALDEPYQIANLHPACASTSGLTSSDSLIRLNPYDLLVMNDMSEPPAHDDVDRSNGRYGDVGCICLASGPQHRHGQVGRLGSSRKRARSLRLRAAPVFCSRPVSAAQCAMSSVQSSLTWPNLPLRWQVSPPDTTQVYVAEGAKTTSAAGRRRPARVADRPQGIVAGCGDGGADRYTYL